jgi:hypothetical protein
METYLSTVLPNGDTNAYADVIAFHGYSGNPAENIIPLINQLQQTVSNHGL